MSPLDPLKKDRLIDEVLMKHFPTITVPHGPLPHATQGTSRLLMATDGLYIDTNQKWGAYRKRIWQTPVPLPYGTLAEIDTFKKALHATIQILASEFMDPIMQHTKDGMEWYGAVGWHNGTFAPINVKTVATALSVDYEIPTHNEPPLLVADIHSHLGKPIFSHTDDTDDTQGVKIAIVVGYSLKTEGLISIRSRYCINRFLLEETEAEINTKERK